MLQSLVKIDEYTKLGFIAVSAFQSTGDSIYSQLSGQSLCFHFLFFIRTHFYTVM